MHEFPDPRLHSEARDTCRTILANLKHAQRMKSWLGDRYTVLRYKDIAENPVETAWRLYKFAGFDMPGNLLSWVASVTHPNKKKILKNQDKPYSPVRNASGNAEKWRQESPLGRVRVIEDECASLLDYIGLERITRPTPKTHQQSARNARERQAPKTDKDKENPVKERP